MKQAIFFYDFPSKNHRTYRRLVKVYRQLKPHGIETKSASVWVGPTSTMRILRNWSERNSRAFSGKVVQLAED